MCSRDDHPPYDDPTDDEMGHAKAVTIDAAIAARSGFPPAGGWQSPLGQRVRRFLDRQAGVPVAYANLTADDFVATATVPPLRADERPFWAIISPLGAVAFRHGRPTLAQLHEALGGYLEMVPGTLPEYTAFVDEDGRRHGWAANLSASLFCRWAGLVGPVVIVGPEDAAGDLTPIPDHVRARLVHEVIEGGRA